MCGIIGIASSKPVSINIINSLKPGDKFFTKLKYLDNKNQRVLFVKKTKIYNKKIKLKKLS